MVKNPFDNNIINNFSDYCHIYQLFDLVIEIVA